ncbi:uncharacterized protein PG986_000019 [Apiospora aurea]|uniref:Uncharacterized protein n=1 Tax=Apiospora aurea TaxID=335848 RepID=A0ABR1QSV1_9PEZI
MQMQPEPSHGKPPTQRPAEDNAESPPRPRPARRESGNTSMSQAEQMISDVEDLYEFGVKLSIFPQDVLLLRSLRKMRERFRSLVQPDYPHSMRSTAEADDIDEDDSSQDSDSEGFVECST